MYFLVLHRLDSYLLALKEKKKSYRSPPHRSYLHSRFHRHIATWRGCSVLAYTGSRRFHSLVLMRQRSRVLVNPNHNHMELTLVVHPHPPQLVASVSACPTTALLIGVIRTVVVAVTSPRRRNAASLLTLKVAVFTRWHSCVREAGCR